MNIASLIGFVIAGIVLWFGVLVSMKDPKIFMDAHALYLVLGGTACATFISFPIKKIFTIAALFFKRVFLKNTKNRPEIVKNLVDAAGVAKTNPLQLANMASPHDFAAEGYKLIADGVLSEHDMQETLMARAKFFKKQYHDDAKLFHSISKYPPAFGLLGAVTGMIAMMGNLGTGGPEAIGKAMAIALVATFWGIALANFVLNPLADLYMKIADEDFAQRQMIAEGLMMIKRRESPLVVQEKLNSYLPLKDRLSGGSGGGSAAKAA
jgi:chemotaxis protein MotA